MVNDPPGSAIGVHSFAVYQHDCFVWRGVCSVCTAQHGAAAAAAAAGER